MGRECGMCRSLACQWDVMERRRKWRECLQKEGERMSEIARGENGLNC